MPKSKKPKKHTAAAMSVRWKMLDGTKISDKRAPAGGHAWGLDQLSNVEWEYGEELDAGVPSEIIPNWPALAFENGVLRLEQQKHQLQDQSSKDDESVYIDKNGNEYRDSRNRPLINDREYSVKFGDIDDTEAYNELKAVFGKKKAKEEMKEHRHERRRILSYNSDTDSDDSEDDCGNYSPVIHTLDDDEDRTCAECKVIVSSPRQLVYEDVHICVDCDKKKYPEKMGENRLGDFYHEIICDNLSK